MVIIILIMVLWYLSGIASFIYWWRHEYYSLRGCIPIVFFVGIIGPVAWFVGKDIHGKHDI